MSTRNPRLRCEVCRTTLHTTKPGRCSTCRRQGVLFPKRVALRLARRATKGGAR